MRATDLVRFAWSNLTRTKLRTSLTATGVMIGTAAVITLLALGNGVEAIAVARASSFGQLTSVVVLQRDGTSDPAVTPASVDQFKALPHVKSVSTALLTPSVRVKLGTKAIDEASAAQTPLLDGVTNLINGTSTPPADGIVVPKVVADALGYSPATLIGQQVTLVVGGSVGGGNNKRGFQVLGPDQSFTARIAGVYGPDPTAGPHEAQPTNVTMTTELGTQIDARVSNLSPDSYLNSHGYQSVLVTVDDARETNATADAIKKLGYFERSRQDILDQIKQIFTILKAGLGAVGGIALLVATIGIANTLVMTILERTREIGIMKALGAEPGSMRMLFLAETGLVGLIGGAAGLGLAALGGLAGDYAVHRWLHAQNPNIQVGSLFVIGPDLVAFALGLALAVALIGGALPSRRAVRLQPLDALRYE